MLILSAMSRVNDIFAELKQQNEKALMPFITAGDPSLDQTPSIIQALDRAGASICEIGFPFSDPIADGPVIQASMTRSLDAGTTVANTLEKIREVRSSVSIGIVAMVSYSIVHRIGLDTFCKQAQDVGVDGLILPDLSLEESLPAQEAAKKHGLTLSLLIAPSTPIERAQAIAKASTGFVYVVSRKGITGESSALPEELPSRLEALRQATDLPIAVGFGISNADHVHQVTRIADAAIVGSALVRKLHEAAQANEDIAGLAESFTQKLSAGLK